MPSRLLSYLTLPAFVLLIAGCGGGGGSAAPAGDSSAPAAEPARVYNWRMVTTWPENLPGMGVAPEKLSDMVTRMSAGRLNIKVYGAGRIVPAFGVFEAVSQGTVEMGHGAAYYWKGKVPGAVLHRSAVRAHRAGNERLAASWRGDGTLA